MHYLMHKRMRPVQDGEMLHHYDLVSMRPWWHRPPTSEVLPGTRYRPASICATFASAAGPQNCLRSMGPAATSPTSAGVAVPPASLCTSLRSSSVPAGGH